MKFAIDLLWVRPNKIGGVEFYIRNLLDGMLLLDYEFEAVLVVANDNKYSFRKYLVDSRFSFLECSVLSKSVVKRILWQNLNLCKTLQDNKIEICFEPVYSKPIFNLHKIRFITTIHDLQALHYPHYQNWAKVIWLRFCWWNVIRSSNKVVAISNFVRNDIIKNYPSRSDNIVTIYNPIVIKKDEIEKFDTMKIRFNIENDNFFYTVSSLLPHKNLLTLVEVINEISKNKLKLPNRLLISGIEGKSKESLIKLIKKHGIEENIIFTGLLSNAERNTLYKYCSAFLFPSIFEGFGMPPIEAMMCGCKVITTNRTCLYEVTQGNAIYVEDPFNVQEWIEKIGEIPLSKSEIINIEKYDQKIIAKKYIDLIKIVKDGKVFNNIG